MTEPIEDTDPGLPEPTPKQRFFRLIARLAHELEDRPDNPVARGVIAALRREDGARSPRFYELAARLLEDELAAHPKEDDLAEAEHRWARVVSTFAWLGGQHRIGTSFGAALAHVDLAEPRFLRLLRADGDALDAALRAAVAPLAQEGIRFDFVDLAALVLSAPHPTRRFFFEDGEHVRRRIARDFYRTQHKAQRSQGESR